MSDDALWDWIESQVGLHRNIEFLYTVDGYRATITDNDGATIVAEAEGVTLRAAIEKLRAT